MAETPTYTQSQGDWLFDYQSKLIQAYGAPNICTALIHLDMLGEGQLIDDTSQAHKKLKNNYRTKTNILPNNPDQSFIQDDIRSNGGYAAWIREAKRINLERSYRRYFHLSLFHEIVASVEKDPAAQGRWNKILGSEENRNLYFEELLETGLLGYFIHFSSHKRSYTSQAITQAADWLKDRKPRILWGDIILDTPMPNMDDFRRSITNYIPLQKIMDACPEGYESRFLKGEKDQNVKSEDSKEETDRLIARNQRFFDATLFDDLIGAFCLKLGLESAEVNEKGAYLTRMITTKEPGSFLHLSWPHIAHREATWSDEAKKMLFILSLTTSNNRGPTPGDEVERFKKTWKEFTSSKRDKVFKMAERFDFLPELYFFAKAEGTYFSHGFAEDLVSWWDAKNPSKPFRSVLANYRPPLLETLQSHPVIAEKQRLFDEADIHILLSGFANKAEYDSDSIPPHISKLVIEAQKKDLTDKLLEGWRAVNDAQCDPRAKYLLFIADLLRSNRRSSQFYHELNGEPAEQYAEASRIIFSSFLHPDRMEELFRIAKENNILPELYFAACTHDSLFPRHTKTDLVHWCTDNGIDLQKQLLEYEFPLEEALPDLPASDAPAPPPPAQAAEDSSVIYLGSEPPSAEADIASLVAVEEKLIPAAGAPPVIHLAYEPSSEEVAAEQAPPLPPAATNVETEIAAGPEMERKGNAKSRYRGTRSRAADLSPNFGGNDREKALKKSVVAKNQRFFDEMSVDQFAAVFAHHLGVDEADYNSKDQLVNSTLTQHGEIKPTRFFRMRWPFIDRQPFDDNIKKLMFLNDLNNPRANKPQNAARGFSDLDTRLQMFERARRHNALPEFYYLINAQTKKEAPALNVLRNHFLSWCQDKGIKLGDELAKYNPPSYKSDQPAAQTKKDIPLPPAPPPRRTLFSGMEGVEEIIIERDSFVQTGHINHLLKPKGPRRLKEDFEETSQEKPRIEWLIDAIKTRMPPDEGTMIKGYSLERSFKGFNADASYGVVEFVYGGQRHQIVTSNLPDRGTFVIKPAIDIDIHRPNIDIAMLLGTGKAWPRRCVDEAQFTRDVLDYCQRDAKDLPPYIASISWEDRKRADVIDACIAFSKKTGRIIHSDATEPFDYDGPFHGITTPARMADAINRGRVLEIGKTTVVKFYQSVPELRQYVDRLPRHTARVDLGEHAVSPPA